MKDIDTIREYLAAFNLEVECARDSATVFCKDIVRLVVALDELSLKLKEFVEDEA